jgi:hypothetical protein
MDHRKLQMTKKKCEAIAVRMEGVIKVGESMAAIITNIEPIHYRIEDHLLGDASP